MNQDRIPQITVLSGKGGTGKTTIVAVLAQLSSPKAIYVDCDVDTPNLHLLLDPMNKSSERFYSGYLAIKNDDQCIECGKCVEVCRFDAISSDFSMNDFSCEGCGACAWICPTKAIKMELQPSGIIYEADTRFGPMIHARLDIGAENSGKLVAEVIQRSHDRAKIDNKQLVIVDGSPGIGCPVIAAMTNATIVAIVVEPTSTAVHDMERTIELVQFFKITPVVIINKSTINAKQKEKIIAFCEKNNVPVVGEIPYNKAIYKSMVNRKTILEYGLDELKKPFWAIWDQLMHFL